MLRALRTQVKWILILFLLFFVLAIPLMYGVQGKRGGREKNGDYPVAEINGRTVMYSQMLRSIQNYVDSAGIKNITSADLPAIHQMVLDQMVLQEALTGEVKRLGLKPSKEDLNSAVKDIESQFPTKEAFQQYLEQTGMTIGKFQEQLEGQLAERLLLEEASASAFVTDEEIRSFYDSIKDFAFTKPEGIEVLTAQFSNRDSAEEALEQLKSGGSWDLVMGEFSSLDLKGYTDTANSGILRKETVTKKMAFVISMDEGTFSDPVELSSDDFMVILRKGFKEKEVVSFDEAKKHLQPMMIAQKREDLQKAYLDDLSSKVPVKILDLSLFPVKNPKAEADAPEPEAAESDDLSLSSETPGKTGEIPPGSGDASELLSPDAP